MGDQVQQLAGDVENRLDLVPDLQEYDFVKLLPREISESILDGLPLQALVPLRLVCRAWNDLITSTPRFWGYLVVDNSIRDPYVLCSISKFVKSSGCQRFEVYNVDPSPRALYFKWPDDLHQLRYARITVVQSLGLVPQLVRGKFPILESLTFEEYGHSEEDDKSDLVIYDVPLLSECVESLPNITEFVITKKHALRLKYAGPFTFQSHPVLCGRKFNRLLRLLVNLKSFRMCGFEIRDCRKAGDVTESFEPSTTLSLYTLDFEKNERLEGIDFVNSSMRILPILPASCKRLLLSKMFVIPQQRRMRTRDDGETQLIYIPTALHHESARRMGGFNTEYKGIESLEFLKMYDLNSHQLAAVLSRTNGEKMRSLRLRECLYLDLGDDAPISPADVGMPEGNDMSIVEYIVKCCQNLTLLDLSGIASDRALIGLSRLEHLEVALLGMSHHVTWFGLVGLIGEYGRYLQNPSVASMTELLEDVYELRNTKLRVVDVSSCPGVTAADVQCLRRLGLQVYYEETYAFTSSGSQKV
ncbi:uncharacterized protein V1518DRAFT_421108 [Limtongia smithiae]|uniref:uncharacterized protein n=1 Tax=Limtongia smithiae TaxID=1125753 RepID=UPI0034CEFA7B